MQGSHLEIKGKKDQLLASRHTPSKKSSPPWGTRRASYFSLPGLNKEFCHPHFDHQLNLFFSSFFLVSVTKFIPEAQQRRSGPMSHSVSMAAFWASANHGWGRHRIWHGCRPVQSCFCICLLSLPRICCSISDLCFLPPEHWPQLPGHLASAAPSSFKLPSTPQPTHMQWFLLKLRNQNPSGAWQT